MICLIEIREREFYIMRGTRSQSKFVVKQAFTIPFEKDLFVDRELVLNDSQRQTIKHALKENGIKERKVHLIINNRAVLSKQFYTPKASRASLSILIENEMKDTLNLRYPATVDYRIIKEEEAQYQVLASAIRHSTLTNLKHEFGKLNLKLASIQSAANALLRTVEAATPASTKPIIIIDITADTIRYYLLQDQTLKLVRQGSGAEEGFESRVTHDLELMNQSQFGTSQQNISHAYVCGDHLYFEATHRAIGAALAVPSQNLNLKDILDANDDAMLDFVHCLGAALETEMNLYQRYKKRPKKRRVLGVKGYAIATSLIIGAIGLGLTLENHNLNNQINQLNAFLYDTQTLSDYEEVIGLIEERSTLNQLVSSLVEVNNLLHNRVSIDGDLLREIEAAQPENLTVEQMTITQATVVIQFHSSTQASLSHFITNLKASETFESVVYDGFSRQEQNDQVRFSGSATVYLGGEQE